MIVIPLLQCRADQIDRTCAEAGDEHSAESPTMLRTQHRLIKCSRFDFAFSTLGTLAKSASEGTVYVPRSRFGLISNPPPGWLARLEPKLAALARSGTTDFTDNTDACPSFWQSDHRYGSGSPCEPFRYHCSIENVIPAPFTYSTSSSGCTCPSGVMRPCSDIWFDASLRSNATNDGLGVRSYGSMLVDYFAASAVFR